MMIDQKYFTEPINFYSGCDISWIKEDKLYLLEEMVKFQEKRSKIGYLTYEMIEYGIPLFYKLASIAETVEMWNLAKSYWRHLICEYECLNKTTNFDFIKKIESNVIVNLSEYRKLKYG